MLIVTTNDVPGRTISAVHGEVFGLTVRSRHIGANIGASFKALAGGELKGITELLHETRIEALSRLSAEAEAKGANAVVAFRFASGCTHRNHTRLNLERVDETGDVSVRAEFVRHHSVTTCVCACSALPRARARHPASLLGWLACGVVSLARDGDLRGATHHSRPSHEARSLPLLREGRAALGWG